MKIGSDDAGANCFPGYIDELRISNNNRYTTTFTLVMEHSKAM